MDITPELLEIGRRLLTQDNQATENPMFCVQEEITIYGLDPRWSDDYRWIDTSDGVVEVEAPEDGIERDHLEKTGFRKYWNTLMVSITREGCEEYLRLNGHNHQGPLRIYVDTFRRCPEMIEIRKFLMKLASSKEQKNMESGQPTSA